jgi:hypothetical protein
MVTVVLVGKTIVSSMRNCYITPSTASKSNFCTTVKRRTAGDGLLERSPSLKPTTSDRNSNE